MTDRIAAFFAKTQPWQQEFAQLRSLLLECGLEEGFKWGWPCYMQAGANIVLMHGFKQYCALLLFKGALLDDADGLLVQQTEHVQAARQIRFTSVAQVQAQREAILRYVQTAMAVEQAGLAVQRKATAEFDVPEEFASRLAEQPALQAAFHALTPGRQRAYLLHFAKAKQSATRTARVQTCIPRILEGKGLDD